MMAACMKPGTGAKTGSTATTWHWRSFMEWQWTGVRLTGCLVVCRTTAPGAGERVMEGARLWGQRTGSG